MGHKLKERTSERTSGKMKEQMEIHFLKANAKSHRIHFYVFVFFAFC